MAMVKLRYIFIVLILLIALWAYRAYASSVGPTSCGTGADDSSSGYTPTWSNPTFACGHDGSFADVVGGSGIGAGTHYIKATNFGFSIPAGATINGIVVEVERKYTDTGVNDTVNEGGSVCNGGGGPTAGGLRIVKGGTISTTEFTSYTCDNFPLVAAYKSYGSSSALWGETWTYSDINSSTFGFVMSVAMYKGPSGTLTAYVDNVRITITYTTVSGSPQVQIRSGTMNIRSGQLIIK